MAAGEQKQFMISYANSFHEKVVVLYNSLEKIGINVFMRSKGQYTFDIYRKDMWKAIKNSGLLCCLVTKDYITSPLCRSEVEYATDKHVLIVFCMIEGCDVSSTWMSSYVNNSETINESYLKEDNWPDAVEKLTSQLKKLAIDRSLDLGNGIKTKLKTRCEASLQSEKLPDGSNKFCSSFNGDYNSPIPADELQKTRYKNTHSAILQADLKRHHSVLFGRVSHWLGKLPSDVEVDQIEVVVNKNQYRVFLGKLDMVEQRFKEPQFQPDLKMETNFEERMKVLRKLEKLAEAVSHNREVKIVRVWHGCSEQSLPSILSSGFAALSTQDDGWYGKAIYFSSYASYALEYSKDGSCLIMCYVIVLNPFPIIADDAPISVTPRHFRFYGRGNHANYQCHYVPVSPVGDELNLDYRPPSTNTEDALYDELAVFQESYILPQIVVRLKPRPNN